MLIGNDRVSHPAADCYHNEAFTTGGGFSADPTCHVEIKEPTVISPACLKSHWSICRYYEEEFRLVYVSKATPIIHY